MWSFWTASIDVQTGRGFFWRNSVTQWRTCRTTIRKCIQCWNWNTAATVTSASSKQHRYWRFTGKLTFYRATTGFYCLIPFILLLLFFLILPLLTNFSLLWDQGLSFDAPEVSALEERNALALAIVPSETSNFLIPLTYPVMLHLFFVWRLKMAFHILQPPLLRSILVPSGRKILIPLDGNLL